MDLRNITRLFGALVQELYELWLLPVWCLGRDATVGWRQFFKSFALTFYADFHIQAGGFDVGMSQPVFDDCDVIAGFDQMKGCCVPDHMWSDAPVA